jgi:hypothetical protein
VNLTQDQIDDLIEYFDSHPNVTLKEMSKIFRVPVHEIKRILMNN